MKRYFCQLYRLTLALLLINIPILYAHNFFNGGCDHHCEDNFEAKNIKDKINNKDKENIDNDNSCLNTSLCRG